EMLRASAARVCAKRHAHSAESGRIVSLGVDGAQGGSHDRAMTADVRVCAPCGEENPRKAKFCMECGTRMSIDLVEELPQQATGAPTPRRTSRASAGWPCPSD